MLFPAFSQRSTDLFLEENLRVKKTTIAFAVSFRRINKRHSYMLACSKMKSFRILKRESIGTLCYLFLVLQGDFKYHLLHAWSRMLRRNVTGNAVVIVTHILFFLQCWGITCIDRITSIRAGVATMQIATSMMTRIAIITACLLRIDDSSTFIYK